MDQRIDTMQLFDVPFTAEEISILCASLPNNKAAGIDLVMYVGGSALHKCIAVIFDEMIRRTKIANQLKIGHLFPAYKGKRKPKNNDNSYRGITLMPTLNKLFEKGVWGRMKKWVYGRKFPHPLQFAGRPASFTLHEAIHYHTERGAKGFSYFLDIEKAYDKIWWDGLLLKLYNLGIRDKLWHLFRKWLLRSRGVVLYDGHLSEPFGITQGIKQGGVLSMFLFTVAVMDIHDYANQASDGLCVAGMKLGSPAYAVLLSNTKSGLTRVMYYMYESVRQRRLSFLLPKRNDLYLAKLELQNPQPKLSENGN